VRSVLLSSVTGSGDALTQAIACAQSNDNMQSSRICRRPAESAAFQPVPQTGESDRSTDHFVQSSGVRRTTASFPFVATK